MDDWLQHYEESKDVKQEWDNINNTLRETTEEIFGRIKLYIKGFT